MKTKIGKKSNGNFKRQISETIVGQMILKMGITRNRQSTYKNRYDWLTTMNYWHTKQMNLIRKLNSVSANEK